MLLLVHQRVRRRLVSSSSPDEEQPSAASTPSPSKKKNFVAPLFPLGAASRTRSKSGSKVSFFFFFLLSLRLFLVFSHVLVCGKQHTGLVDLVVVWSLLRLLLPLFFFCIFFGVMFILSDSYYLFLLQDSDMIVDDIVASPLEGDDLQTATVDQDKDLRKSVVDSSEVGAESTGEGHSSSSDSLFDSGPGSVPEEQIMSAGSNADDDDMPGADDSSMGPAGPMGHNLAIVPHASHGRDDDSTVDSDVDPLSFSVPQTVLTSRVTGILYPVLISFCCVDEKYTHVYYACCVLICRRF